MCAVEKMEGRKIWREENNNDHRSIKTATTPTIDCSIDDSSFFV
jgi:hypothetical protein